MRLHNGCFESGVFSPTRHWSKMTVCTLGHCITLRTDSRCQLVALCGRSWQESLPLQQQKTTAAVSKMLRVQLRVQKPKHNAIIMSLKSAKKSGFETKKSGFETIDALSVSCFTGQLPGILDCFYTGQSPDVQSPKAKSIGKSGGVGGEAAGVCGVRGSCARRSLRVGGSPSRL